MKDKKLFFIFNPRSGKELIRNHLVEILDIFVKAGYEVTARPTQARGDAQRMVAQVAGDYDLIVCSGGDGTLDEVMTGMMQTEAKTPVGYIPAGSTNDFAYSIGIPSNMTQAAKIAVGGTPFPCDMGSFNDDNFVYIAAFGLFTDVSYMTNQRLKNVFGHMAYIMESAKRLVDIPAYKMEVHINDEIICDEFIYGMITNSTSVGGFKTLIQGDVELDDGEFEVLLIRMPQNPKELNEILTDMMLQKMTESQYIFTARASHIEIHSEVEVPWTLDGEYGGNPKDVVINNHCRRISFMV